MDSNHVPPTPRPRGLRLARAALLVAAVLAAVPIGAATAHTVATARDARRHPPTGDLVSVDGRALHVRVSPVAGAPSVVFLAGTGTAADAWHLVLEALDGEVSTLAYDRAGLGHSAASDAGKGIDAVLAELDGVLEASGLPAPYVLVGHSQGGSHALAFAAAHPDRVVGVVAVDAANPSWFERIDDDDRAAQQAHLGRVAALPTLARFGGLRVLDVVGPVAHDLPSAVVAGLRATTATVRHQTAAVAEFAELTPTSSTMARVRDAIDAGFADLPLAVLTRSEPADGMTRAQRAVDAALAGASTSGWHVVVAGVDHAGMVTDRRGASAIADAVRSLVAEVGR